MFEDIVEYSFSETYKKTFVFLPGYTGGLEVATISKLVEHLVARGETNVFGIPLSYQSDTADIFDMSQRKIVEGLKEIVVKAPKTELILVAKSLSGSLALYNHQDLPADRIVILGCSIVLGWPQRISLLQEQNPTPPDYKAEWNNVFESLSTPTLIINGDSDDLTDNEYLSQMTHLNPHIKLAVIEQANHNLENVENGELMFEQLTEHFENFLTY